MALVEEPQEPLRAETPQTLEEQPLTALEPWSDYIALKRVKKNFEHAENYTRLNHSWRWSNADELYLGWMQQKFWEGTKIPRSSLPVYLTFEHIESALPQDIQALFGEPQWFDMRPFPVTTQQESSAIHELMLAQNRNLNHGTGIREVFRKACKCARLHGNGIIYQGWKRGTEQKIVTVDQLVPERQTLNVPGFGPLQVPTGKMQRNVQHVPQTIEINEPILEYVSLRDFFIDPHCPSPLPWEANYAIRRKLVPLKLLYQLAGQTGFNIPDLPFLLALATTKEHSLSDQQRHVGESMRDSTYSPTEDYSVSGEDKRIEVLEYWTNDRLVWLLGRKHIAYNVPNPYGWIPFLNIWYADVLDRFYALGMTDILEPEQRLQQSIINARVDELSLSIHPPAKKRRGIPIPLSQLRRRPGLITEMEDPETDLVWEEPRNVTAQAFVEVAASEQRAQRRDGITELAVLGTPGQGSSINRTATGIQTMSTASRFRIGYFIENVQENVIIPMLNRQLELNQRFNTQQDVMQIMGEQGQQIQLQSDALVRAKIRFEMRAANKATSRSAVMQILPLLVQSALNPEVLRQLSMMGMTMDVNAILNLSLDSVGRSDLRNIILRKLTPQEMQMMQQNQIDQTKIMTQQIRGQSQMEITQEKGAAAILSDLMKMMGDLKMSQMDSEKKEKKEAVQ